MDAHQVISSFSSFLHESSLSLANWLSILLPKTEKDWWEDCVLGSLSPAQRDCAVSNGFAKLSDLDFAALLRVASKSWYDLSAAASLPSIGRETVREMIYIDDSWSHRSSDIPDKDSVVHDLSTTRKFLGMTGGNQSVCADIEKLILDIGRSGIAAMPGPDRSCIEDKTPGKSKVGDIHENSLVYLVASPETRGIVVSVKNIGPIVKYGVFVNNSVQNFFTGQIAPVEESAGYNWVGIDRVRSFLTAYQINNPSSQNLYSLNAARIDFVPYQFRPALKMIHSDEPRILIADSVGVGKTIEAGLVIKELEARTDLNRVVVICPRPLVAERKWELEMKRFDEEFVPLDGSALRQIISDTDRDGEWPSRYGKVIIPYSILDARAYNGQKDKRFRTFGLSELDPEPHFDLVIVDEAHHIRNGSMDKDKAFAYKCTKYFCDHADAVIMLTATPIQTSDNDLFTILNVLRPDIVIDQNTFKMMSEPNAYISKSVHLIRSSGDGWAGKAAAELRRVRKTQWGKDVIVENPLYDDILRRLEAPEIDREERIRLISDIESLHSFAVMLSRTRRRDIQDFCVRRTHTVSVEFTGYQQILYDELLNFESEVLSALHDTDNVRFMMSTITRQAASCVFGLAPHIKDIIEHRIQQVYDDPEVDLSVFDGEAGNAISAMAKKLLDMAGRLPDEDPKFDETLKIIRQKQEMQNNKIMLFSTFRHTLGYLRSRLTKLGFRVEQIDGSVKDEDRYRLKAKFELPKDNPDAIDILLFTEVGSEGLDYQFCDMMINYDLPWNPMRIEQRIGRIDRHGQQSDVVNIYNVVTEGTVDAEIYHRCLMRIGVFERNIGDCEKILGEIAEGIEKIAISTALTDEERKEKLEQIADNEVRKVQELNRLEDEEKELFGFDFTEFTVSQEIKKAESPWISQYCLQKLVENYLTEMAGPGTYIIGDGAMKNLRLSARVRSALKDELRRLPGGKNALRREWENYLCGTKPNHPLTFDPDAAKEHRESFFITAMHPLARQASLYFSDGETSYLHLRHFTHEIPPGDYAFSVYAWKYTGMKTYTRLVTVCKNETLEKELPSIMESACDADCSMKGGNFDWSSLEDIHVQRWIAEKEKYRTEVNNAVAFRLESLANSHEGRVRTLNQHIEHTSNENIKMMRKSQLEKIDARYEKDAATVKETSQKADIYMTLLVNGVVTVREG